MLNIYYADESCDKEKFIFDHIDPDEETIVIVPDQASLQMESNALSYFRDKDGRSALLDLMVTDFSSLGHKVISESGCREPELIDKYGRQMLLSILIDRLASNGDLGIYKTMRGKNTFAAGTNQLISEMKRSGVSVSEIEAAAGETDSFLKLKLSDIGKIFRAYEESIEDRFTDTEDYIRFYGGLMEDSPMISRAVIWIIGFDTFTPLNIELIKRILSASGQVNVVMTWSRDDADAPDARKLTTGGGEGLFDLTGFVMETLKDAAEAVGTQWNLIPIDGEQRHSIWHDDPGSRISLVRASNIYAEADRVAACIMDLVREKEYRYRDIAVICNDMDVRGNILCRTFERWGIPSFADRKRRVLHQPVVRFLMSLLKVVSDGYTGSAVMEMVSSGLMGWSRQDEELLSNYADEAKIRGNKWKQEFTWSGKDSFGGDRYGDDLEHLNEMRSFIVEMTEHARDEIGRRNSAGDKIRGLNKFLEEAFDIRGRIDSLIARQTELGLAEGAAETAQSWNMICNLFTQIIRVIGEDNISNSQLREILAEGLREMEIGLVPASTDCVLVGTLQRTRISRCPVLIVTAANEGILPMGASESGLLTERELEALEDLRHSIAKKDEVRRQEEQLAVYRMFSLPSEELIVTCSMSDQDGKSITPSSVFTVLSEMDGVQAAGDLGSEDISELIASRQGSLAYMADAMQGFIESGRIADVWLAAMNWYSDNAPASIDKIRQGLDFDNRVQNLDRDFANSLYFGDRDAITVSASRLEVYSSCPFKYFIEKGLKADEPDGFETSGRSRGDVFHKALQEISVWLTPEDGTGVTSEGSPWITVTEAECREKISEIITGETAGYREGVYLSDNETKLQLQRITDTCSEIAWSMIGQVRKSRVSRMYFEEPFNYGSTRLRPIEIELEGGKKAVVTGVIDRLDVIDVPQTEGEDGFASGYEAIRIVDYKTGSDEINVEQIEEGYKLQLMLYMNVAEHAPEIAGAPGSDDAVQPAGVFYFKIHEVDDSADGIKDANTLSESVEARIEKACRLEGIMVGDENRLRAMDENLAPKETSAVLPVRQLKSGEIRASGSSAILSDEEFDELCEKTAQNVRQICHDIQAGLIEIAPKREKNSPGGRVRTSCTYCSYKSICMFDTSFSGCRYKLV